MTIAGIIRYNYRNGWQPKARLHHLTCTLPINAAAWSGEINFEATDLFELGDELQINLVKPDGTETTLWLGQIVARSRSNASNRIEYRARGLAEHFLDLPYPYTDYPRRTRTPSAPPLWESILQKYLDEHTSRYTTLYDLPLTSINADTVQFTHVADAYRYFRSLTPCRLVPELLQGGNVRWKLTTPNTNPYILPAHSNWELREQIIETGTRLTLEPPARQLIRDRRITHPDYWVLERPTLSPPITVSITPLDINSKGYFAPVATRLNANYDPYQYDPNGDIWVSLHYTDRVRVARDFNGNRKRYALGAYLRGQNLRARWNVNGVPSTFYTITGESFSWFEMSLEIIPNTDDLDIRLQFRPDQPGAMYAVIDGVYLVEGTSDSANPLRELARPAHAPYQDQIYSTLSNSEIYRINSASGSNPYTLSFTNTDFTTDYINATVELLTHLQSYFGTITAVPSTTSLQVQFAAGTPTPQHGQILLIHRHTHAETKYDTLYRTIETPAGATLAEYASLRQRFCSPQQHLLCTFPYNGEPLPEIGQTLIAPNAPASYLEIQQIELSITNGTLSTIRLSAGTPERTLRAYFRSLKHPTRLST